ncbi:hypothetical protein [Anatilimnocola floriformis]|uniref:hypothetical protein n=1 Tax=Anatilimnocola floriformis TaxID=2948575 RepID=UPI0020C22C9D|nr:hypothetical protein [Anatilimnocola floriformis]
MGATGWTYLREFDGDPERMLRLLHEYVFAERLFQFPHTDISFLEEMDFFEVPDEEREELVEDYGLQPIMSLAERVGLEGVLPWIAEREEDQTVATLDDLRVLQCLSWDGTHSALDICDVADHAKSAHLFPLVEADRIAVFGKERVQFENVVNRRFLIGERRPGAYERLQPVYVPVYTGERLTHAYIEGISGD